MNSLFLSNRAKHRLQTELQKSISEKINSLNISINRNHRPQTLLETITIIDNNNKYSILGYLLTRTPFGVRHSFCTVAIYIHFGSFKCLIQSAQSCEQQLGQNSSVD